MPTFEELGVNNLLTNIENVSIINKNGLASADIPSGEMTGDLFINKGFIRSKNYIENSAGWTINDDGSAEFSNVKIRGTMEASTINIPNSTSPLFSVDIDGNVEASSLRRNDFHWFTLFESADGFSNDASVSAESGGIRLQTTAVIDTEVSVSKNVNTENNFNWSKRRNFKTAFYFVDTVTSIRCGIFTGGTRYDNLDAIGFGFEIFNDGMTGIVASGTDHTAESLVTISAGQTYEIKCDYVPGEYVKFYVNGVLEATITTDLPSGDTLAQEVLNVELINNNIAENRNMLISYYDFWQSN